MMDFHGFSIARFCFLGIGNISWKFIYYEFYVFFSAMYGGVLTRLCRVNDESRLEIYTYNLGVAEFIDQVQKHGLASLSCSYVSTADLHLRLVACDVPKQLIDLTEAD